MIFVPSLFVNNEDFLHFFFPLLSKASGRSAPGSMLCSTISLFFKTKKRYFYIINYL